MAVHVYKKGKGDTTKNITSNPSWAMTNPVTGIVTDPKERFIEQYGRGISLLGPTYYESPNLNPAQAAAYQATLKQAGPLYAAGMSPEQLDYWIPNIGKDVSSVVEQTDTGYGDIASLINSLTGGGGASASDKLSAKKYADERADRAAKQRALQGYLTGGGLAGMFEPERGAVESQAQRALANIAAGYEAAQGLSETGYGELQRYLEANRVNPYANMTVSAGLATNPMEQFLQAYGASSPEVQAQVAAEQAAREGGAGAFRNLVDVLSGAATQAQSSREAEAQMARNMAAQLLGQQRAGYVSQAEMARQQALAAISQRENERKYALQQALMELGINPAGMGTPATPSTSSAGGPTADDLAALLGMA